MAGRRLRWTRAIWPPGELGGSIISRRQSHRRPRSTAGRSRQSQMADIIFGNFWPPISRRRRRRRCLDPANQPASYKLLIERCHRAHRYRAGPIGGDRQIGLLAPTGRTFIGPSGSRQIDGQIETISGLAPVGFEAEARARPSVKPSSVRARNYLIAARQPDRQTDT